MLEIDKSKIRKLDGSILLVFREVLRHRSGTAAAKRLNLSQSTVSHALARLRNLFDDDLFIRSRHGLEPTQKALDLGPQVDDLIDLAMQLTGGMSSFDPTLSDKRFSIAAPEFLTTLIGPPLSAVLGAQSPGLSFGVEHMGQDQVVGALRRGEIDLALGRLDELVFEELAVRPLFEDQYCAVVQQNHPSLKDMISVGDLKNTPLVLAHAVSEFSSWELGLDIEHDNIRAVVPHWMTALTIVAATDAVAVCPRRFAEYLAPTLRLKVLEFPVPARPITISMARRKNERSSAIDWLEDQVVNALQ